MEKTLVIDLDSREDFFEKYNKKKVSKDLISYMVRSSSKFKKNDKVKVIINNNFGGEENCTSLIKAALLQECANSEYKFHRNNLKQIFFFIFGALALIISTFVNVEVLKEIILIGAWVFLWDMVELEIDDDVSNRKKKKILKKLLTSQFVEKKKDQNL